MEKLKTLTIRQIHDWRPSNSGPDESFGRKALEKLFGGDSIPVLQFVDLDIPSGARLFVVLRPEVLGDAFAPCLADIAEHVLPIFQQKLPDDERPARAIAAIRGFARGEVGKGDLLTASRATENAGYDDNAPTHGYPPCESKSPTSPVSARRPTTRAGPPPTLPIPAVSTGPPNMPGLPPIMLPMPRVIRPWMTLWIPTTLQSRPRVTPKTIGKSNA